MSEKQSAAAAGAAPVFAVAWCGTDLGAYRACEGTYECYPYESLPPLDPALYTGEFEWLGGVGVDEPGRAARVAGIGELLAAEGLALPRDFAAFHSGTRLHRALDEVSVTACRTDLSAPLPSPVEPGAFLVRFLRDQQDCVIWYLYLRPGGEAFVVCSHLEYEYVYDAHRAGRPTGTDLADPEEQRAALVRCAESFEEFAHRFWIENVLWDVADGGRSGDGAAPALQEYARHYEAAASGAGGV
ncbi:hypothetical protein SUDANB120_05707 [Streptomyces sp. enrichment culture]|uniref:hypothetical protein n=1 Tax=Streptomyces sp. enrichment culture TaxID=1795815 RepID=UPI003F556D81